ncbi:MAG: sulfotransferase [Rhizobiales bacterium]|nr:sulfotransferase [Hyphomicrobiales bacterium]
MAKKHRSSGPLPQWLDRGVLVYGPRKAGTTLFQNLLDGSGQLLAYPAELKLKYFARHPGKAGDIAAYHSKSRIASVKSSRFNVAEYEKLWAEALDLRQLSSFGALVRFDAWAVQQSISKSSAEPELWCAKEVGGPADSILADWRRMFPKGKALFIVREPLMITRAVINDRRRKKIRLSFRQIVRETIDPMRVVAAQSKYLNDPYVHILTYENLVEDTAGTMRKAAAFLGIPYSPVFTTPTIFGEPQIVRTSSRKTTEVFAPAQSWTDGLTARERWIVAWTSRVARHLPAYSVTYHDLRARIERAGTERDRLTSGTIAR